MSSAAAATAPDLGQVTSNIREQVQNAATKISENVQSFGTSVSTGVSTGLGKTKEVVTNAVKASQNQEIVIKDSKGNDSVVLPLSVGLVVGGAITVASFYYKPIRLAAAIGAALLTSRTGLRQNKNTVDSE